MRMKRTNWMQAKSSNQCDETEICGRALTQSPIQRYYNTMSLGFFWLHYDVALIGSCRRRQSLMNVGGRIILFIIVEFVVARVRVSSRVRQPQGKFRKDAINGDVSEELKTETVRTRH